MTRPTNQLARFFLKTARAMDPSRTRNRDRRFFAMPWIRLWRSSKPRRRRSWSASMKSWGLIPPRRPWVWPWMMGLSWLNMFREPLGLLEHAHAHHPSLFSAWRWWLATELVGFVFLDILIGWAWFIGYYWRLSWRWWPAALTTRFILLLLAWAIRNNIIIHVVLQLSQDLRLCRLDSCMSTNEHWHKFKSVKMK